ncbi:hypothetical protein GCM10007387_18590 [Pseudoduganella albidiflava]|uniref:Uncharacterized protein n=1 Tax=Pseudoduganella albidiflava TaxID=321983 RepID=A0AA87XV53_9BURK|nr:hypothetical protein GCM10007387_18590 [Pseudoduganella albidiflava]
MRAHARASLLHWNGGGVESTDAEIMDAKIMDAKDMDAKDMGR